MAQNQLVEQAKLGNVNAIASLMNRLLKSQGMLANVERDGDRLEILIESDLRSLDDEMRIPKRQILVGMLKKWFITLEVQTVASIKVSWQQTGFDEPAWTEEIYLTDREVQNISQNGGVGESPERPKIPPLPVFPPKPMHERHNLSSDRDNSANIPPSSSQDLDEMFGETNSAESLTNVTNSDNLSTDLSNGLDDGKTTKSDQDSELLFLSDIAPIPIIEETGNDLMEQPSPSALSLQILFKTPSFPIQLVQYAVVCAILILTLRGIHSVLGSSKAPKASSISTQFVLL